jgi:acyl-CoA thioesterase I
MLLTSTALALAVVTASVLPTAGSADSRPRIVALGDSLTSGHGIGQSRSFPAVLQKHLKDSGYNYSVVNAGVSGDTSGRAVQRFRDALQGDVQVLIVALGANDGLRGVPVADLRRNLVSIIEEAQARRISVLLCAMEALPMYGWNYTVSFHQTYVELARIYRIPLVPFMMMNVLGNPSLMQADRVHPNAEGARVMADHVWPYLEALLRPAVSSRSAS